MNSSKKGSPYKFASPQAAFSAARRRIVNNALRRQQASLDLSNFGLVDLPIEIGELKSLRNLNISNNQLTNLPSAIGKIIALEELQASENKIVSLPDSLGFLTKLKTLDFSANKIRSLPGTIGNLISLEHLNLDDNNLKDLPSEIGDLRKIVFLQLGGNQLASLPPEIGRLNLFVLVLEKNQMSELPAGIASISSLESLDLDDNKLSSLPSQFAQLKNLEFLYLNRNQFTEFPGVVTELPKLRSLMLGNNRIQAIPRTISQMESLNGLHLAGNEIRSLPPEIAKLKFRRLNVANNQLTLLPNELGTTYSLEEQAKLDPSPGMNGLFVEGNPLPEPYERLIADGQPTSTANVLAWLRGEFDPANLAPNKERPSELTVPSPPEPDEEAGPTFHLVNGQVDLVPGPETSVDFDRAIQETLHRRLQRQVEFLREATVKVGNQHPQLVTVVEEYAKFVQPPITELDIVDLWATGNALMAQAGSFQRQDITRTLSEPLEPSHLGLLTEVAALHGGFILGFPKAAQLTSRADQSRVGSEIIRAIGPPTSNVLSALSRQRRLLSERARNLIEALDAALLTGSWNAARIGYTGYATVRNALVAIGKICIWINDKGGSLLGSALLGSAVADLPPDTLPLLAMFLKSNSANILAFAAPFPELYAYLEWIIDHLDGLNASSKEVGKLSTNVNSAPSSTYTLFRKAILAEQQIICNYGGGVRELYPHVIGTNKSGEEVVLAWQIAGASSGKLPQWRCLKLANVQNALTRDGLWREDGLHRVEQTCVTNVDLDINVDVRKLR